jgi:hypothetical protein
MTRLTLLALALPLLVACGAPEQDQTNQQEAPILLQSGEDARGIEIPSETQDCRHCEVRCYVGWWTLWTDRGEREHCHQHSRRFCRERWSTDISEARCG